MYHQPNNYSCHFSEWLAEAESEYKQQSDIIYQDDITNAFISPKWWGNNPGHVIIIPNKHSENIYDHL